MKVLFFTVASLMAAPAGAHACWIKDVISSKHGVRVSIENSHVYLIGVASTQDGGQRISDRGHLVGGRTVFIHDRSKLLLNTRVSFDGCLIYPDTQNKIRGLAIQPFGPSPVLPMPIAEPPPQFIPASHGD
jgi:hypothetical protein